MERFIGQSIKSVSVRFFMGLALKLSLNPFQFVSDKALVGVNKTRYRQAAHDAILQSPNRLSAVSVAPYIEILASCR